MAKAKTPDYLVIGEGYVDITLFGEGVDIGGTKVKKLRMREPIVDDQLAVEESSDSEAMKSIKRFANLCEIAPADIRKMTMRNYERLRLADATFTD